MKKVIWVSFLSLLTAGLVSGAAFLKLDQPNGGEALVKGSPYPISWTVREVTQNVKLILLHEGAPVGVIADSLAPGSSPYRWTIGKHSAGSVEPDSGYAIRIKTMDGSLLDVSDGTFTITSQAATPSLKVTFPIGGETFQWGGLQPFQWSASGIAGNVKVTLLRNGSPVYELSPSVSVAAGAVGWTVGNAPGWSCDNRCGGGYKLRVEALDGSASAESPGTFSIAAAPLAGGGEPDFELISVDLYPQCLDDPVAGGVMVILARFSWRNNGADYVGPLKVHYIYLDALKGSKISKDAVLEIPSVTIPKNKSRGDVVCEVKGIPDGVESITFAVMLDPDNQVRETNEKNNYADATIKLPRNPDLVIEDMRVSPNSFYNDEVFDIDFTVRNKGFEPANQFSVRVTREDWKGHIQEILYSVTISTLGGSQGTSGPSSFQSFHGKYKLALQPAGAGIIRVTADSGKQIAEFNEKNNWKWDGYTIRPTPDLTFFTASVWQEHMQLHYEVLVTNKGDAVAEGVYVYIFIESHGTRELRKIIDVGKVGYVTPQGSSGAIEITWPSGKYLVQFIIAGCCKPGEVSSDKRYHDKNPTNNTKEIWRDWE